MEFFNENYFYSDQQKLFDEYAFNIQDFKNAFQEASLSASYTQHTCLCQTFAIILSLSYEQFWPLFFVASKLKYIDFKLIHEIFKQFKYGAVHEHHFSWCLNNTIDVSNNVFHRESIFNTFYYKSCITYHCNICKFQKMVQNKLESSVMDNTIFLASPKIIKCKWMCVNCKSDVDSFIQITIDLPEWQTCFILFCRKGVTSLQNLYNMPDNFGKLQTRLYGKLMLAYIVADVRGKLTTFEFKDHKLRTMRSGVMVAYKQPPFAVSDVRCIVWQHSNPHAARQHLEATSYISVKPKLKMRLVLSLSPSVATSFGADWDDFPYHITKSTKFIPFDSDINLTKINLDDDLDEQADEILKGFDFDNLFGDQNGKMNIFS